MHVWFPHTSGRPQRSPHNSDADDGMGVASDSRREPDLDVASDGDESDDDADDADEAPAKDISNGCCEHGT